MSWKYASLRPGSGYPSFQITNWYDLGITQRGHETQGWLPEL
ncbi:hypothetical protein HCUR_01243 [Holospora curviuscula]|uniref:Uncharacterized protein n=1 Tax=Holospora curviuscula TaxID=1082868 RepID=A0A2S5R7I9_9PROT|nr:hypothetical protein HCUR_01243 [Holospora curviuscula]